MENGSFSFSPIKIESQESLVVKLEALRSKWYEKIMFEGNPVLLGYGSGIEFRGAYNLQTLLSNKPYFGSLFDKDISEQKYRSLLFILKSFDKSQIIDIDTWDNSNSEVLIKDMIIDLENILK